MYSALGDEADQEAVTVTESSNPVLADGSFPWWFLVLGVTAVALGALFAFRPIKVSRR